MDLFLLDPNSRNREEGDPALPGHLPGPNGLTERHPYPLERDPEATEPPLPAQVPHRWIALKTRALDSQRVPDQDELSMQEADAWSPITIHCEAKSAEDAPGALLDDAPR